MGLKICTKCGEELPATKDFFHISKSGKLGLRANCKVCEKERVRKNALRYYYEHKEEVQLKVKEYEIKNSEIISTRRKLYRDTEAAKEIKMKWNLENKESIKETSKLYRKLHREEFNTYKRNRNALKLQNGGTHTVEDILAIYNCQQGLCFYCGTSVEEIYHVDHVIPIILGGFNGAENLVITCPSCNLTKNAKHPLEFMGEEAYFTKATPEILIGRILS